MTSSANLNLVRSIYAAWERGDTGRGKTRGLELGAVQSKGALIFHVRDGRVGRLVAYRDHERARADLGLSAEDPT